MRIFDLYEKLDNDKAACYVLSAETFEILYMNKSAVAYSPMISEGGVFFRSMCGRRTRCENCPMRSELTANPVSVGENELCSFANVRFYSVNTDNGKVIVSMWKEPTGDILEDSGLFDVDAAVKALGNSREAFDNILNVYFEEGPGKLRLISEHIKNGIIPALRIDVHGLKSTSYVIGANALGDLAKQLEFACRDVQEGKNDDNPGKFIADNINILVDDYKKVICTIAQYFSLPEPSFEFEAPPEIPRPERENDNSQTADKEIPSGEISDTLRSLLEKSLECLTEYELDPLIEYLNKAQDLAPDAELKELIKRVIKHIDEFDYSGAEEILKNLLEKE